ncbi:hypothetical protein COU76_00125 [Candidatus Peregrinibacteria bacterium CG10_big_fil_rev_8_21_14_0_10_49_10]|nr:MAG: hypothetical protein COU76_00125 [Candidatus Peregrinibacteria bacterium CG10_big_fil_rev_8_21_14_0_10_49_10]
MAIEVIVERKKVFPNQQLDDLSVALSFLMEGVSIECASIMTNENPEHITIRFPTLALQDGTIVHTHNGVTSSATIAKIRKEVEGIVSITNGEPAPSQKIAKTALQSCTPLFRLIEA